MSIEFGAVPDWIAAVSTALGLGAAGLAARFTYRQVKVMEDENRALDARERESQASMVAVWLQTNGDGSFSALALNRSGLPVYRIVIGFISPNHDNLFHLQILPPLDQPILLTHVSAHINNARETYPNIDASWSIPGASGPLKILRKNENGTKSWETVFQLGRVGLTVTFTDAHGIRWERDLDGRLTERPADYKPSTGGVLA